jgi:hypothetical protein
MAEIVYKVSNNLNRSVEAQAIPSYAPKAATEFFTKLECFCFQQQTLDPHQMRDMPVVFVIDPNLPKDVKTITLSYTFFELGVGIKYAASSEDCLMKKQSSFLQSMKAVMWGFLGVRKQSGLQDDAASLSFVHIILAGILGAVVFMAVLLLIVRMVVSS